MSNRQKVSTNYKYKLIKQHTSPLGDCIFYWHLFRSRLAKFPFVLIFFCSPNGAILNPARVKNRHNKESCWSLKKGKKSTVTARVHWTRVMNKYMSEWKIENINRDFGQLRLQWSVCTFFLSICECSFAFSFRCVSIRVYVLAQLFA